MYIIVTSNYFLKRAKKFFRKHPELKERFANLADDIKKDPFQPHLQYHHLGGNLKGIQAVSITDKYRISLTIVISEKEIILLDIGTHDEVYRKK